MKNFIILCIATLFMSCAQQNSEANETSKNPITKSQKTDVITDNTTKIEILLDKGEKVTMISNENISYAKNKKYLDRVTLFRIISNNNSERSTSWILDTKYPETKVDTTLFFCSDYGLKKIQYRQGYISAIYE